MQMVKELAEVEFLSGQLEIMDQILKHRRNYEH